MFFALSQSLLHERSDPLGPLMIVRLSFNGVGYALPQFFIPDDLSGPSFEILEIDLGESAPKKVDDLLNAVKRYARSTGPFADTITNQAIFEAYLA